MADYYRSVDDVIYDILWPGGGMQPQIILDSGSQRHNAIVEVLRRIPELEYSNLENFADDFFGLFPHRDLVDTYFRLQQHIPRSYLVDKN